MKKRYLFWVAVSLSLPCPVIAGTNQTDTFTINTYYPSPRGIYKNLEAKRSFAIGEVHSDPKVLTMDNLTDGQLYVGDSLILKSLAANPASGNKAGQMIYNGADRMLRFYNGSAWVNMTAPSCPTGKFCRVPNTCDTPGYSCKSNAGLTYYAVSYTTACHTDGHCNPPSGTTSCPSGSAVWSGTFATGDNPPFTFYTTAIVCAQ